MPSLYLGTDPRQVAFLLSSPAGACAAVSRYAIAMPLLAASVRNRSMLAR